MKMQDIKTLITSGANILAFGSSPAQEKLMQPRITRIEHEKREINAM